MGYARIGVSIHSFIHSFNKINHVFPEIYVLYSGTGLRTKVESLCA